MTDETNEQDTTVEAFGADEVEVLAGLAAASGCASTARRFCDLLAMKLIGENDVVASAKRARAFMAQGTVQLDCVVRRLEADEAEKAAAKLKEFAEPKFALAPAEDPKPEPESDPR